MIVPDHAVKIGPFLHLRGRTVNDQRCARQLAFHRIERSGGGPDHPDELEPVSVAAVKGAVLSGGMVPGAASARVQVVAQGFGGRNAEFDLGHCIAADRCIAFNDQGYARGGGAVP
ncbi:MAG: hypothetical protein H6878_01115 [Rhodobiaceae bacterium]|nr:hypothetical protein [Rhodobiaceae bacterium]